MRLNLDKVSHHNTDASVLGEARRRKRVGPVLSAGHLPDAAFGATIQDGGRFPEETAWPVVPQKHTTPKEDMP